MFWENICFGRFNTRMQDGRALRKHSLTSLWLRITFDIVLIAILWTLKDIRSLVPCRSDKETKQFRKPTGEGHMVFAVKYSTPHYCVDGLKGVYF